MKKQREEKKVRADELQNYMEESRGLERDYIGELVSSRRLAWFAAAGFGVLAAMGVAAGIAGLSQTAPDPVVLRVDNTTGAVERVEVMREVETTYGEVVDRYFLNKYVLNRESYDYDNIQISYDTTALMSSGDVQQEYYKLFQGSQARDVVLSNRARLVVSVRAIHPENGLATVRFTVQQVNRNGTKEPIEHLIATIGYSYVRAPMTASDRRINPLGFQVTSYRVDTETLGAN
ncbi:type IV secretion system protein [Vibrio parahaemolyticus]|uniref:virB8 family protein n=1 Tax=Vibrio parahaemolyticus TaxID=670 RepID=UPI002806A47A|nr:type IV secretion system protein [Vibrio parahaemolyticus]EJE4644418.1 type IV secretion system protein [Vibrio parahaemolyticus]ELA9292965.1 type IV secretion system protein [Vibrio parahaemolyticus]MDS1925661.1 type IV secretion system protein [Vibrio parahaemolyticus]